MTSPLSQFSEEMEENFNKFDKLTSNSELTLVMMDPVYIGKDLHKFYV